MTGRFTRPVFSLLALVFLAASLLAACADDGDGSGTPTSSGPTAAPADKITFMAGFKHQANLPFVGAYVAQEKGFFAEENLDVTIRDVATPGDNFRFLATNEVQFTTADSQVLLERRSGDPSITLVSVALIGQRGQQGFAVLKDSGIASPKDWAGKTAGYKGAQVTPDFLAILNAEGVDRSSINEVKIGFDPSILTEEQVDIFPVFISNEPDTLRILGYETTVFEAADYGAPTLGLNYVAMREYIDANPDIVQRFVRAALKGIAYADQNPAEAIQIVLKYAPTANDAHEMFTLQTELAAAKTGEAEANGTIGWQTVEQWQRLHDYLVQYGALRAPLDDVAAAFTNVFVEGSGR
jgi:ABC-type nitrate/sulfonate/bicarbonate transport system substrate-binding protein